MDTIRELRNPPGGESAPVDDLYLFDLLMEHLPEHIYFKDRDSRFTRVNRATAELFGVSDPATLIGKSDFDFFTHDHAQQAYADEQQLIQGQIPMWSKEERETWLDGHETWVLTTKLPLRDPQGNVIGTFGISRDITERKRLELQLAQAQKLESIGQLAAGIAHEINTPIQYIGDNAKFLDQAFRDLAPFVYAHLRIENALRKSEPELAEDLARVFVKADIDYLLGEVPAATAQLSEGVERVARIVRTMKEFSHPGALEKAPVDLNHAIEGTILVSRNEWKYVADLTADFDPELPPVPCIAGEINQAVFNLISNAAQAIADVVKDSGHRGAIHISTRRNRAWAEIRVRDTGAGIPEAIRSRVFDPFFTTKQVGKGIGQGLSIAHSVIVQNHRGRLSFDTQCGAGTTFLVQLPLEQAGTS
jgi:PAS domain S-box-containing protein